MDRRAGRALALALGVVALAGCSVRADVNPPASQPPITSTAMPTPTGTPPLIASPSPADPALERFYGQGLNWTGCDGDFQCATLTVPRSYDDPNGPTLGINVIRLPASGGDRIGSLVLNPGGPGGSGIDYARAARAVTTSAVREHYDIVGFDPRGVGTSDPIHCMDDAQTDAFIGADASPDDAGETRTLVDVSKALGADCQRRSPDMVAHVGTRDVARDLDVLRAVLGDQQLHYLGKSYGTAIGATYAELFPTRVGRMVLDGALDPALDSTALAEGQAAGFEQALRRFAEKCPQLDGCPLDANPDTAVGQVRSFLTQVDAIPLDSGDPSHPLTESWAVLGIIGQLYDAENGWPDLARALGEAFTGDGSALMHTASYYVDRTRDGHYTTNANDAIYAVNCWDKPATPDAVAAEKLAAQWKAKYPTFGSYLAWGNLPCATWPGHSSVAPAPAKAAGSPPIVVVGTLYDPATPVQWARALAGQLAQGVYLEWEGDGHTAYQRGSGCIDDAVDAYLIDGTPPAAGTVCR